MRVSSNLCLLPQKNLPCHPRSWCGVLKVRSDWAAIIFYQENNRRFLPCSISYGGVRGCVCKGSRLSSYSSWVFAFLNLGTFRGKGCLLSQSYKVRVLTNILPVCEFQPLEFSWDAIFAKIRIPGKNSKHLISTLSFQVIKNKTKQKNPEKPMPA